jgi:hypothetical protein
MILITGTIAGVLFAQRIISTQLKTSPDIGMFIGPAVGTLIGASVGSYIQYKRNNQSIIDELNESIIDNSMIHGFIAYSALTGYQAFTKAVVSPSESFILVTFIIVVSLILQSLNFLGKPGEIFS